MSKIDRVAYGLLTREDLAALPPNTPLSRRLMAVPFVGKDVPSRSSEFAHPDALIGLTILAYRYEGLRRADVRRVVAQLKADFARQAGPRDHRPASRLFAKWLELSSSNATTSTNNHAPSSSTTTTTSSSTSLSGAGAAVLPLALFEPSDSRQLDRLCARIARLPELAYYYLRQHVFPATMNFQAAKLSACGHALGSKLLFSRRLGFSGTPSNLLPLDLGQCQYEPGSDGEILHVLTSPLVVSAQEKHNWYFC